MSSHHIVKDKQEPALMFANGASCDPEIVGNLLEWSPYILVLDGALDRVLMQGIKVDAVLGDFDSVNVNRLSVEQEQSIEWIHTPDQSFTDFDKGLEYLIDSGHTAVNVVWATGKRMDHTVNNLYSLARYSAKIQIVLYDDHSRIFILPKEFKKYYPADTKLSIIPITNVEKVTTRGLLYNIEECDFVIPNGTGSSNEVVKEGIVEISHHSGVLCLMECVDGIA